jgi:hypothetical protein
MHNQNKGYVEFLLLYKIEEISEVYASHINKRKISCFYDETYMNEDLELATESKVRNFFSDILANRPQSQIRQALDNLRKNQLVNSPDLYIALLDEILHTYQLILGIAVSYLHEYVSDADDCHEVLCFFETIGERIENKVSEVRDQIFKKRCPIN